METVSHKILNTVFCQSSLGIALLFLCSFSKFDVQAQKPKLINYFLKGDIYSPSVSEAQELAKWDVIILDMENQQLHKELFSIIRNINPNIKILAYIKAQEIEDTILSYATLRSKLKSGIKDEWWLYDSTGNKISVWHGTHLLNVSNQCPQINGYKWNNYLANFICNNILSENIWDGVFLDNCWDGLNNVDSLKPDIDRTGKPIIDKNWRDIQWIIGMDSLITSIRSFYPDKIITGNKGFSYTQQLNGSLIENFPLWETSWEYGISEYLNSLRNNKIPSFSSINCYNKNQSDYKRMRFGLTSCLLGNGYYSFDYDVTDHGQTWWYDEYNVEIGEPLNNSFPVSENEGNQLLQNNSFENGLNSWVVDPSTQYGQILQDNSTSHSGNFSIKCIPNSPDSYWKFTVKQTGFQIQKDSLYKIGFWAKASSRRIMTVSIIQNVYPFAAYFYPRPFVQLGTEWKYYEYYFSMNTWPDSTIPISNPSNTRFSFELGWDNSTIWIDDVSMKKCTNSLWKREFSNGLILCNPTNNEIKLNLGQTYYHIAGNQDPLTNSGQPCTDVTIPSKDGLILLKSKALNLYQTTQKSNIRIYPNPAKDKIIIETGEIIGESILIICNVNGQEILKQQMKGRKIQIDISSLASGSYLVKLKNNKTIEVKILVKK
jgi:hypothetical protein